MSAAETRLAEDRATRDAAREVFGARLERVRGALSARSLGGRVTDEAVGRAKAAAGETIEVVRDYRWIVAGTFIALLGWLFRRPLVAATRRVAARFETGEPASRWQRWQAWAIEKVKP